MLIIYDYINTRMKAVLLLPMLSLWTFRVRIRCFPKIKYSQSTCLQRCLL